MIQIGKYRNTNLIYTNAEPKWQKDPTRGIFLKRGLFKDIFWVSHSCTRSSSFKNHRKKYCHWISGKLKAKTVWSVVPSGLSGWPTKKLPFDRSECNIWYLLLSKSCSFVSVSIFVAVALFKWTLNTIQKYVRFWPLNKAGAKTYQLYNSVIPRKIHVWTSPKHHTLRGYTGQQYKTRKCHQFPLRVPRNWPQNQHFLQKICKRLLGFGPFGLFWPLLAPFGLVDPLSLPPKNWFLLNICFTIPKQ